MFVCVNWIQLIILHNIIQQSSFFHIFFTFLIAPHPLTLTLLADGGQVEAERCCPEPSRLRTGSKFTSVADCSLVTTWPCQPGLVTAN